MRSGKKIKYKPQDDYTGPKNGRKKSIKSRDNKEGFQSVAKSPYPYILLNFAGSDTILRSTRKHHFENPREINNKNTKINHFRFIDDEIDNVQFSKSSHQGNWNNPAGRMKCLASRFFLVEVSK